MKVVSEPGKVRIRKQIKQLSEAELDELCAKLAARIDEGIRRKVKEHHIVKLDVSVQLSRNDELNVDVDVDLQLNLFYSQDFVNKLVDEAVEEAFSTLEKEIYEE